MSKLFRFLLKYICRRIVIQGHNHKSNIIEYFSILADAVKEEFTEDNNVTLNEFLSVCHKISLIPKEKD
jgi:predicted ATPase